MSSSVQPDKKPFSMIREFHLADWFTLGNAVCGVGSMFSIVTFIQTGAVQHAYYACALVLAAPMYNFAIPSTLKAWLDHVLRAGVTFKYTETGPQGLLTGKKAYVLTARGGLYAGSTSDHQEPYLRQVMAFVGIHDVTFIHAEGMNLGGDFQEKGLNQAKAGLSAIA